MTGTLASLTGLDASAPEPLPFAPALHVRAFALRRARGDVLVYAAPAMRELDGVSRWYLNHRHEAMFAGDGLDAPLFVHADDRAGVDLHVRGTFSRRHMLDEDLEVIPTPGHTPGATAYLWDGGEHRFLFTGDTIYLAGGEWVAAVLESSDRAAYLDSLELIRGLDFDVLVPWAASAGEPFYALTTPDDSRRRIDAIIDRVRGGASR
jgi:glyoxylase-like metal-dependent hydrolase (beta-lactamase superfamily II)